MEISMFLLKSFIKIQTQGGSVLVFYDYVPSITAYISHHYNLSRVMVEKYWIQRIGIQNLKLFENSWILKCTVQGQKKPNTFSGNKFLAI